MIKEDNKDKTICPLCSNGFIRSLWYHMYLDDAYLPFLEDTFVPCPACNRDYDSSIQ